MLPIDRTSKSALDGNLVNGNTSDAPVIKNSNDVVYNTIDELNAKVDGLVGASAIVPYPPNFLSRQAIINGNFDVWQRGTSSIYSAVQSLKYLDADRWRVFFSGDFGVTITQSRQLTSGFIQGSRYFYRIHSSAAGTALSSTSAHIYDHLVENGTSYLCGAGKKITISFWARSSIPNKKIAFTVAQDYGSGGTPSGQESLSVQTFTLTAAWTKYTFTFTTNSLIGKTFGTNNDDYLFLRLFTVWGSTYNFGGVTENYSAAGDVDIAQVQINAGDTALPFQPRSYADELRSCQRYYQVLAAETNADISTASCFSTTVAYGTVSFDEMRIPPTVTISNPSDFKALIVGNNIAASTITTDMVTNHSSEIIFTISAASFTAGSAVLIRKIGGTGKIGFDAEL